MHYALMVLGPRDEDELEEALAPFDENSFQTERDEDGYPYNPDAHWDWWQLGGRFTGCLRLREPSPSAWLGGPGVMGAMVTDPWRADTALVGEVDWDAMITAALDWALDSRRQMAEAIAECGPVSPAPQSVVADAAWREWWAQPTMTAFLAKQPAPSRDRWLWPTMTGRARWVWRTDVLDLLLPLEAFEVRTRNRAVAFTYAVLHDGRWLDRSALPDTRSVRDQHEATFDAHVARVVAEADPLSRVWIVDCHS